MSRRCCGVARRIGVQPGVWRLTTAASVASCGACSAASDRDAGTPAGRIPGRPACDSRQLRTRLAGCWWSGVAWRSWRDWPPALVEISSPLTGKRLELEPRDVLLGRYLVPDLLGHDFVDRLAVLMAADTEAAPVAARLGRVEPASQ